CTIVVLILTLAPAAQADGPQDIQRAIERGVTYLKNNQSKEGSWTFTGPSIDGGAHIVGITALAGLALLECDVPDDDPAIQGAARVVRYGMIATYDTYDLALVVMFLDRLRDADDEQLIHTAAGRLLAGQTRAGGWSYVCPRGADAD